MTSGVLAQRKETHCAYLLLWEKKEGKVEEGKEEEGEKCKVVSVRSFVVVVVVVEHRASLLTSLSLFLKVLILFTSLRFPLKLKLLLRTSEKMML